MLGLEIFRGSSCWRKDLKLLLNLRLMIIMILLLLIIGMKNWKGLLVSLRYRSFFQDITILIVKTDLGKVILKQEDLVVLMLFKK